MNTFALTAHHGKLPVIVRRRVVRVHGHKLVVAKARAAKRKAVAFEGHRPVPTPNHSFLVVDAFVFARRTPAAGGNVVFHPR